MRPDLESLVNEVADELASALRHYGPGSHPGTGTEQQVHAGGDGRAARGPAPDLLAGETRLLYGQARVAPAVDWNMRDLQDSGPRVNADSIREDYAKRATNPGVYEAWLEIADLPSPKLVEEEDDDNEGLGGYGWDEYGVRNTYPPIKIAVDEKGQYEIVDGNHRLRYWEQAGFQWAPAWVLDYRLTQAEVDEAEEDDRLIQRHYGPGAHPGTGTDQQVHAGDGERAQRHPDVAGEFNRYMEANRRIEGEPLGPRDLAVAIRQARLTPGTDEWRERRNKWEAELATLGEARVQDGTWIGPSGKILGPGADHQQIALALLRWDLHALGGEAPGIATDLAVLGGLIRYNVDHYSIYFDIPSLDQTTDGQWAAMAGLVSTRTKDEKVVPALTISVGGAFRPTTYYDGADAYDQLDLDPQDLADQFDAWQGQGVLRRRHYGPGEHPGTGTPQEVHAGGDGREKHYASPEWKAKRQEYEKRLAEQYGMAEPGTVQATSVAWIGPRGWLIAPEGDHQESAMWLTGKADVDLTGQEGIRQSIHATDEVVNAGLIRVNADKPGGVAFDLPGQEDVVTDEQWSAMAALLTQAAAENAEVPPLTITFGGPFGRELPLGEPGAGLPPRVNAYDDEAYELLDMDRDFLRAVAAGEFGKEAVLPAAVRGLLRRLHYGPGAHPGTDTEQQVHAGGNGRAKKGPKARWSPGTEFRRRDETGKYRDVGSLTKALEGGNRDVYIIDPVRGLGINMLIQDPEGGAFASGIPEGVDFEGEMARVLEVYDRMQAVLTDPKNAQWLEVVDRHGEFMRDRALRYTQQVEEGAWKDRPRMGLNVVFTNNRESAGAGSAGDWGGRVFWVPTSIPPEQSVIERGDQSVSLRFGLSPVYVTMHELHHAWGSSTELDHFSTAMAADYYLANRDLLTPRLEASMVHDVWSLHSEGSRRASGDYRQTRLAARAAVGWLYKNHGDYFDSVFSRIEANIASPDLDFFENDRAAWEWLANPGESRQNLTRWAKTAP